MLLLWLQEGCSACLPRSTDQPTPCPHANWDERIHFILCYTSFSLCTDYWLHLLWIGESNISVSKFPIPWTTRGEENMTNEYDMMDAFCWKTQQVAHPFRGSLGSWHHIVNTRHHPLRDLRRHGYVVPPLTYLSVSRRKIYGLHRCKKRQLALQLSLPFLSVFSVLLPKAAAIQRQKLKYGKLMLINSGVCTGFKGSTEKGTLLERHLDACTVQTRVLATSR